MSKRHRGLSSSPPICSASFRVNLSLSIVAGYQEVHSPLGSPLAIKTLEQYGIKYHLGRIVSYIWQPGGEEMCPRQKLSVDKGFDEFYAPIKGIVNNQWFGLVQSNFTRH